MRHIMKLQSSKSIISLDRFTTDVKLSDWSDKRRLVAGIVTDKRFEIFLAICVLVNLAAAVIKTDHKAKDEAVPGWVEPVELALLVVYVLEMLSRFYVFRSQVFTIPINVFEFGIVVVDVVFAFLRLSSIDLPQIVFLRVLRLVEVLRVYDILVIEQQLQIMVEAVISSVKATFFGCFFICMALVIYSIVAVEYLRPLDVDFATTCTRCPEAFSSVYFSVNTFIETVIVGDEWGTLFLPYLDKYPSTALFIIIVFVTINFGLMNVIFAVIVDSAAQARIRNIRRCVEERQAEVQQHQKKLEKHFEFMDADGSKAVTMEELMQGYQSNLDFRRTLHSMDIAKDDLVHVFKILDEDDSGDVGYEEFVQQLCKMRTNNPNTMLVFIKHYVAHLRKDVSEEMVLLKGHIAKDIVEVQRAVAAQMELIKENIDANMKVLAASDKRVEETLKKEEEILREEEQLLKDDIALHNKVLDPQLNSAQPVLPAAAESFAKVPPATFQESFPADGQLQMITEQVAAALEDLRCNCESSAQLLSSFHHQLLPGPGSDQLPSLRRAAHGHAASHGPPEHGHVAIHHHHQVEHLGFWESRACCSEPQIARGHHETPAHGASNAYYKRLISRPPMQSRSAN